MKEKKTDKRAYAKPACETFGVGAGRLLQASGNAGTISPGGSAGDAKRGWFDEEETSPQENGAGPAWED